MKKTIFATIVLFAALATFATPPSEEGKSIFAARCAACHNVTKTLVGPALAGVYDRRPIDWIVKFVHSSQAIIKTGDPSAIALFTRFKVPMPDHPDLTADNIKNIVEYIKTEAEASNENTVANTEPVKAQTDYLSLILINKGLLVSSLLLVAILIAALWFLVKVKQVRNKTS